MAFPHFEQLSLAVRITLVCACIGGFVHEVQQEAHKRSGFPGARDWLMAFGLVVLNAALSMVVMSLLIWPMWFERVLNSVPTAIRSSSLGRGCVVSSVALLGAVVYGLKDRVRFLFGITEIVGGIATAWHVTVGWSEGDTFALALALGIAICLIARGLDDLSRDDGVFRSGQRSE